MSDLYMELPDMRPAYPGAIEYPLRKIPTVSCLGIAPQKDGYSFKSIYAPHEQITQDSYAKVGDYPRIAFLWNVRAIAMDKDTVTIKFYHEPLWKNITNYYISCIGDLYRPHKSGVITDLDSLYANMPNEKLSTSDYWIARVVDKYAIGYAVSGNNPYSGQWVHSNVLNGYGDNYIAFDPIAEAKKDVGEVSNIYKVERASGNTEVYLRWKFGSWSSETGSMHCRPLVLNWAIKDKNWDVETSSSSSNFSIPSQDNDASLSESHQECLNNANTNQSYYDSGCQWARIIIPGKGVGFYYFPSSGSGNAKYVAPGNIWYYTSGSHKTNNLDIYYYSSDSTPKLFYSYHS